MTIHYILHLSACFCRSFFCKKKPAEYGHNTEQIANIQVVFINL
nr:MAG TPA: hypothetical protein [Caudoviricetes sp.]